MIGCLWLIPDEKLPNGIWLIGTGVIILGLMLVRYLYRIHINGFWFILGVLALAFGLGDFLGVKLPLLPILIVLVGIRILFKPKKASLS